MLVGFYGSLDILLFKTSLQSLKRHHVHKEWQPYHCSSLCWSPSIVLLVLSFIWFLIFFIAHFGNHTGLKHSSSCHPLLSYPFSSVTMASLRSSNVLITPAFGEVGVTKWSLNTDQYVFSSGILVVSLIRLPSANQEVEEWYLPLCLHFMGEFMLFVGLAWIRWSVSLDGWCLVEWSKVCHPNTSAPQSKNVVCALHINWDWALQGLPMAAPNFCLYNHTATKSKSWSAQILVDSSDPRH